MRIFFIWFVIVGAVLIPYISFSEPMIQVKIEPKESITLKNALALAIMHNPQLQAFSFEKRAKEARVLQSGLSPNPKLNITIEDAVGSGGYSGFNQSQTTIQLSQLIELGGKRAARLHSSNLLKEIAEWNYETKRIDILTQTAKSFALLLKAQQLKKLSEELVLLSEQFLNTVKERIKAGKVAVIEKVKYEINLSSIKIELENAKRELKLARGNLSITWGTAQPQFQYAIGNLNQISNIPSLENLKTRLTNSPDHSRRTKELEQRHAALNSEISKSIPNVRLQGGYRRIETTDDNALIFGLSIPLQFFNRNQGAIEEARHKLAKTKSIKRADEASTEKEFYDAYNALVFYRKQVASIKNQILPGAKIAFQGIQEGYRYGKFGLMDVLDSQRTYFETQKLFLDSLVEYHIAVAVLERLIGEPLAALTSPAIHHKGKGS